jgi:CMP-N,N'-diacetyllegionaminic acid synthase
MKVLGIVPARAESKRLPGKNIKILGDKPLINWTIEIAKESSAFSDIIVSTDGEAIASIARNAGANVPWLRPTELASDDATSVDVAIHALDWYEEVSDNVDALVLLQPTSPFRTVDTIKRGLKAFEAFANRTVVSVSLNGSIKPVAFKMEGDFIYKQQSYASEIVNVEKSSKVCVPNGILYVISPHRLRTERSFFSGEIVPLFPSSSVEAIDIDTLEDWEMAERIVEVNQS